MANIHHFAMSGLLVFCVGKFSPKEELHIKVKCPGLFQFSIFYFFKIILKIILIIKNVGLCVCLYGTDFSETTWPNLMKLCMRYIHSLRMMSGQKNFNFAKKKFFKIFQNFQNFSNFRHSMTEFFKAKKGREEKKFEKKSRNKNIRNLQ